MGLVLAGMLGLACLGTPAAYAGPLPHGPATSDAAATAGGLPSALGVGPTISVDDVSPAVVTPTSGLTVRVTIAMPDPSPDADGMAPTVRLLLANRTVISREQVHDWSTDTTSTGTQLAAVTASPLGAGRMSATLTVPAAAVRLGRSHGVLPLVVTAKDPSSGVTTVLHTFAVWQSAKEYEPVSLSVVAPLGLDPDPALLSGDPTVQGNAWRTMAAGGRAERVLAATAGFPVTYAVDPALVTAVTAPGAAGSQGTPASSTAATAPASAGAATSPADGSGASPTALPSAPTASPAPTAAPASTAAPVPATPAQPATTPTPTAPTTSGLPSLPAATLAGIAQQNAAVTSLATRLAAVDSGRPVLALPWGDLDVAAAADLGSLAADGTRLAAAARTSSIGGEPVAAPVVWPADGTIAGREDALHTLMDAGPGAAAPAVTLVAASATSAATGTSTPQAVGMTKAGTPVLVWDEELSEELVASGSSSSTSAGSTTSDGGVAASGDTTAPSGIASSPALAGQLAAADSVALLDEAPGTRDRAFLLAIPRSAVPDVPTMQRTLSTLAQLPWVSLRDASSLVTSAQSRQGRAVGLVTPSDPVPGSGSQVITPAVVTALSRERGEMSQLPAVLSGTTYAVQQWSQGADELLSARWRTATTAFSTALDEVAGARGQLTGGISVTAATTNFLADEGQLTVTVVNDTDYALTDVRLRLTPQNPRMRITDEPAVALIAAHSRATVRVSASAIAAGLVPIAAQVVTPAGASIGASTELTVRANPPGKSLYVVFGAIVALLLVAGFIRSARRWRRSSS